MARVLVGRLCGGDPKASSKAQQHRSWRHHRTDDGFHRDVTELDGTPLRPAILWMDARADAGERSWGRVYTIHKMPEMVLSEL
jgi:hypothetical protein